MKKLFIYISALLILNTLKAQDDGENYVATDVNIDSYYNDPIIDWTDDVYNDFFANYCTAKKKNASGPRTITNYNQFSTSEWWWDEYYDSSTRLMAEWGCATTCCAMILSTEGWGTPDGEYDMDPGFWNEYLNNNDGYDGSNILFEPLGYATNNEITFKPLMYSGTDDDDKVAKILKSLIDNGGYAILRLTKCYIKGLLKTVSSHFVLIYDYDGDGSDLKKFIVADPGTSKDDGIRKQLGDYYPNPITNNTEERIGKIPIRLISVAGKELRITNNPKVISVGDIIEFMFTLLSTSFKKSAREIQNYCNLKWVITNNALPGVKYISSGDETPSFTFDQPGTYNISLAINGEDGFYGDVQEITVTGNHTTTPNSYGNTNWTTQGDDTWYICTGCVPIEPVCTEVPKTPVGLGNSMLSESGFTVSWSSVICAKSYKVYIYNNGNLIAGSPFSTTSKSYTASGSTANTRYFIQVSAVNDYGESAKSVGLNVTTLTGPVQASFSYVGNNWYATAMNTVFTIQDHSVIGWGNNAHIWVCFGFNEGNCGTLEWNAGDTWAWFYTTEVYEKHTVPYPSVEVTFKKMGTDRNITHVYDHEGNFLIRYLCSPYHLWDMEDRCVFNCDFYKCDDVRTAWGGATIVDCNKTRTASDIKSSVYSDYWGWDIYFSGSYVLNSLSKLGDYNNKKTVLSACKSIELDPGVSIAPTSGNYMSLEVGKIEGSRSSSKKSEVIPDDEIAIQQREINNPNPVKESEIIVFPNPSDGNYTILSNMKEPFNVIILNATGTTIKAIRNCVNGTMLNIASQPAGVYFMQVESRNKLINFKVIKY